MLSVLDSLYPTWRTPVAIVILVAAVALLVHAWDLEFDRRGPRP